MNWLSELEEIGEVAFPDFNQSQRVIMMPYLIGDPTSIPEMIGDWREMAISLTSDFTQLHDQVGYLTIDQRSLAVGETLRRGGKHVESGYIGSAHPGPSFPYIGSCHPMRPDPWRPPSHHSTGTIMASSVYGCDAWVGEFSGIPELEGSCDHLADQCTEDRRVPLLANKAYWANGGCVHESLPVKQACERQWIRITFPSDGYWWNEYTHNPLGIKPSGPIRHGRKEMAERASCSEV